MTWIIQPKGDRYFVVDADAKRRVGPFSQTEAQLVATALSGLARVRLTRQVIVTGGVGQPGQVVELPKGEAQLLVYHQCAEMIQ